MSTSSADEKRSRRRLPVDPAVGGLVARFLAGAQAAVGAVGLVFGDAKLFTLSLIPMGIHLVILLGLLALGFTTFAEPLISWLGPKVVGSAPAASSMLADVGVGIWSVFVNVLVAVAIVLGSLVLSLLLASVVCDPFFDAISERTEALYVGHDVGAPFSIGGMLRGIAREFVATLVRLGVYAAVAIPLWLLSFTPAGLLATPLALVWTWLFIAYEFLCRALVRHANGPRARLGALFQHKAVFVGFGGVAWLMSFVPFTAPLLIAGATRLYLSLAIEGHVPSGLSEDERVTLRS